MKTEPALTIGVLGTLIGSIIVLLRSFGVDITEAQESAIKDLALILFPIVTGLVIRSFVVSPATAKEKVEEAHAAGQAGAPVPSVKV